MNEIDVSKCEYYDDYYKDCSNYTITGDKPYCSPKDLKCSYYIKYIENKLQQLKAENESYEYQLEKRIEICDIWVDVTNKYKQCLDEIKGIAQKMPLTSYYKKQILQLIKQAKEG